MAILFGLAAAVTYGAADFLGGLATRTTKVLSVVFISQVLGSVVLVAIFPLFTEVPVTTRALMWGAASGLAGAVGIALFYQALALGKMGVIAPITAVEAASVPVLFGLIAGERPSPLAMAGVVLALVAVALVSSSAGSGETHEVADDGRGWRGSGLVHALAAGLGFGAFFILLDRAGDDAGLWPLVGARVSSLIVIGVALLVSRKWERPKGRSMPLIVGAGVLDVAANLFYLLGTQAGLLSVVAVLTSMYPATTVLLARVALAERLARSQRLGLAVAVAGVVAIALG